MLIMLLFGFFLGCGLKSEKAEKDETPIASAMFEERQDSMKTITTDLAVKYSLNEAELAFGPPGSSDEFVVDGALPEFRIGIYNFISKEEYTKQDILIKEMTWKKDENTNVTVWYVQKEGAWVCLDALEWPNDAIF